MKKVFALIIMVAGLAACTININGFGDGEKKTVKCTGEVIEKDMQLSGFDSIEVLGSADIDFTQASDFSVIVKANEEVFDYIDFEVENGTLVLKTKDNVTILAKDYDIYVKAPVLKEMDVKGAADFDIDGYESDSKMVIDVKGAGDVTLNNIKVPELSIEVKGAGDIDIDDLDAGSLTIDVEGAGDARVSGRADEASFKVSGAGSINARGLKCDNVSTTKNGLASISLEK